MNKFSFTLLLIIISLTANAKDGIYRMQIDLQGKWQFATDAQSSATTGPVFNDVVMLPGTTDTNHKGTPCTKKDETTHLTRLFSYVGKAWYRRTVDIPKTWKKHDIYLHLERTKPTNVFVDATPAGKSNDISTEQVFDLTRYLTPGRHEITIMVDNGSGVPKQLYANSHAYTEDTQTNWNGIIGRMYLEAANPVHITDLEINPDPGNKRIKTRLNVCGIVKNNTIINLKITSTKDGKIIYSSQLRLNSSKKDHKLYKNQIVSASSPINDDVKVWSEFHPDLYILTASIDGVDSVSTTFGFRDFKAHGHHFYINGNKTYLRGKHDACVFPLTAHVPMDVASWRHHFGVCRQYGINHVRFHSWCPPEAAFQAADEMGIYLQPELPFWGDFNAKDTTLMTFLHKEGENIVRTYGHHPSFVMMALGNELWGSIDEMKRFTDDFRGTDSTKLYTFGSNYYLGYKGWKPGMDYFTTCRVGGEKYGEYNTHVRGSFSFADAADGGIINHEYPNTRTTFENAIKACPVPVISHETAQFQTYPDYDEIKKYKGVLYPYSMEVFRSRLQKAGMGDQAEAFHKASGLWSAQLYKADIEMDLRTGNMGGFQLLDLQDYPGQGSAYIGILDAFMESKGIVDTSEWRGFCAPVVPLLEADTYCFTIDKPVTADVKIANYSEQSLKGKTLNWLISTCQDDHSGAIDPQTLAEGNFAINTDSTGLINAGRISANLRIGYPAHLKLLLGIDRNDYHNAYDIWVYPPKDDLTNLGKGIIITTKMTDEIGKKLASGARVLFMPDSTQFAGNTVDGLFQTDYWSYRMFKTISESNKKPVSPGTLGILTDARHPIFSDFPTGSYTSWQWFPIIKASHPLILDHLPQTYRPVVQVIDNIERNHKLGLIMEFAIGKGKLLICMSDLKTASQHAEGRQLYKSILEYMHSDHFHPAVTDSLPVLMQTLQQSTQTGRIDELRNISFE